MLLRPVTGHHLMHLAISHAVSVRKPCDVVPFGRQKRGEAETVTAGHAREISGRPDVHFNDGKV